MTPLPGSDRVRFWHALSWDDWLAPVRKRWLVVLLFSLGGLACAGALLRFFPDVYVSRAVLRFVPPQVPEKFVAANDAMQAEQRLFALTQLLSSSLTARKTIDAFGLYPERRRLVPIADLVPRFQKALEIRKLSGSDRARSVLSVAISFAYSDPEKARQVVMQLVETVHETNRRYRGDQSIGTTDFLAAQTEAARQQVEELEDRILELGMADRLSGVHHWSYRVEGLAGLDYRLARLQSMLYNLRNQRADALQDIAAVEGQIRRVAALVNMRSEPATMESMRLRYELDRARAHAEALRRRYTAEHPELAEAEAAVSRSEALLQAQVEKDVEGARERMRRQLLMRLDDLRAQAAGLEASIRNHEAEEADLKQKSAAMRAGAAAVPEEEAEYFRLRREHAFARDYYQSLLKKQKDSEIASEMERIGRGETVEMVEPPEAPLHPKQPNWILKLLLGTALGALAGIAFALWPELLTPRLRSRRQLSLWGPLPLLAELPGEPLLVEAPAGGAGGRVRLPWRRSLPRRLGILAVLAALVSTSSCGLLRALSKEELVRMGNAKREAGEYRAAALLYRRAIAEDRRYAAAYDALARVLIETGAVEAAHQQLTRAAELLPGDAAIQIRLAGLTYEIYFADPGRPRALLAELEDLGTKIVRRWPSRPEGYCYLAQVLVERGRAAEAVGLLERGAGSAGRVPALLTELASIEHRRGNFERAERLLAELIDGGASHEPAFDLAYLQRMDRRKTAEACEILRKKWARLGGIEAGLQLAAHLYAAGSDTELAAHLKEVLERLKEQPEALARVGDFWLHRGRYSQAEGAYTAGLEKHPARRALFAGRLVELKLAREDRSGAERLLEAESRRSPSDPTFAVYRAALDLDTAGTAGQMRARKQLEEILRRMPRSAFVRFHLGRAYLKLGELARAGAEFESCVRLDPNYAPGWLALADTDLSRGLFARAESALNRVSGRAPAYTPALVLKARLEAARGRLRQAGQALESVAAPDRANPEVLSARGEIALSAGEWAAAAGYFEQALKALPGNERAVLGLVRARLAAGQTRDAKEAVEAASVARPGLSAFRAARAAIAMRAGEFDAALKEYRALAAENPGSPAYALGAADALALRGQLEAAIEEYRRAASLDARDPRPWLRRAAVAASLGKNAEAREALGGALARNASDPVTLNNLAYLLAREGRDLPYALQLAEQAAQLMPSSPEIQDTLAYLYLRQGMREKAVEAFDRLIALAAKDRRRSLEELRGKVQRGEVEQVARLLEASRDRAMREVSGASS